MKTFSLSAFLFTIFIALSLSAQAQILPAEQERALRNLEQNQQRQENLLKNLEEEQERTVRERKKPGTEEELLQENQETKLKESGKKTACFEIKTIELKDATILKGRALNKLIKPYLNTCMTLVEINQLMHNVTNYYISHGYVTTRVAIPQQNLKSGHLELLVIEGVIEDIILNENTSRDRAQVAMAFPFLRGKILNLRDIEQGLDQLNRLASSTATMQLIPGGKQGGTKVVINNKIGAQNRGSLGYDNSGQNSTGKNKVLAGVERDNLLGIGDYWSLNYNKDTAAHNGTKGSEVYSGYFSLPFGYWTFSEIGSHSEYLQTIRGINQNFQASGETDSSTSKLDRVVFRNQNSKISLNSALKLKNTKAFIEDAANTSGTYQLTIWTAGADYVLRALGSVWSLSGGYERGISAFGATKDIANIASDAPHAQFDKYTIDATVYKPFTLKTANLAWRSIISGQYSNDTLYASERISMGDRYTVRGFDNSGIAGDSGIYNRNEIMWNLPQFSENKYLNLVAGNLQPYVALDMGTARAVAGKQANNDSGVGYLSGWAIGLRNGGEHIIFDLAYSQNIASPAAVTDKNSEVYFMVTTKWGF